MILEVAANAVTTLSIWLAVRNSIHTWWTSIIGCLLFLVLFFQNQLYADSLLQVFFMATSILGWWQWKHLAGKKIDRPISNTTIPIALLAIGIAASVAIG